MLLLVGMEKGGTGKTTLAVNLAVMRALAGHETLLVDTDLQESASTWATVRAENNLLPSITCVSKRGKVGYDLAQLKPKFDTIIVDAGGRDSLELRQSMVIADRMVIPIRPSQFDSWSLDRMVQHIKDVEEKTGEKLSVAAMMNAVSTNRQVKEVDEMRHMLADYQDIFPVLNTTIGDRIVFRRAARDGLAVVELKNAINDEKAIGELTNLYHEVFGERWKNAANAKKAA